MFLSLQFYSEVVSTSGSAAMLTLTVENMSLIVTLGQVLLSWCQLIFGFEMTLSLKLT